MPNTDIQISGYVTGLSESAFATLRPTLSFDAIDYKNRCLTVEFEGSHYEIEEFFEELLPLLDQDAEGLFDYYDRYEWTLARYRLSKAGVEKKRINLNDALERYNRE